MSVLFEPYELCGIQLRNRFVRSATMENMALENGHPLPQLFETYRELAEGGVGMVNTSAIFPEAGWNPGHPLKPMILDSDKVIPLFAKLVEGVHRAGARITAQLAPPPAAPAMAVPVCS